MRKTRCLAILLLLLMGAAPLAGASAPPKSQKKDAAALIAEAGSYKAGAELVFALASEDLEAEMHVQGEMTVFETPFQMHRTMVVSYAGVWETVDQYVMEADDGQLYNILGTEQGEEEYWTRRSITREELLLFDLAWLTETLAASNTVAFAESDVKENGATADIYKGTLSGDENEALIASLLTAMTPISSEETFPQGESSVEIEAVEIGVEYWIDRSVNRPIYLVLDMTALMDQWYNNNVAQEGVEVTRALARVTVLTTGEEEAFSLPDAALEAFEPADIVE